MKPINKESRLRSMVYAFLMLAACAAGASAHNIKGIEHPTLATARITSPTTATDVPVPIFNTGVSVACFNVRNTSPFSAVITGLGLDLPGDNGEFSLVLPTESIFTVESNVDMDPLIPNRSLDFAFLTGPRFNSHRGQSGLLPSTQFTTFCVSGAFPPGMNIEQMLNHVFVRFSNVGPLGRLQDVGIWENAPLP
jgi:hypothetical protein